MQDKLTPTQKKIVRTLAEKGCKCHKDLLETANKKTVTKALHKLASLDIIEIRFKESEKYMGRKKAYYGLTWKGLAYALSHNIISPEKGYEVMDKNKMKFPAVPLNYVGFETLPEQAQQNELVQTVVSMWDKEKFAKILELAPKKHPGIFFSKFEQKVKSEASTDYAGMIFQTAYQMFLDDFAVAGRKYGFTHDPVLEGFFKPYKKQLLKGMITTLMDVDPSFKKTLKEILNS